MLFLESLAALLALLYILLAIKEDQKCWYAAILSSALYIAVFYDARLYLEAGLQIFFIVLAFYGLKKWQKEVQESKSSKLSEIQYLSLKKHIILISLTTLVSLCLGFIIDKNTNADLPYLDALITCFSVTTTYLVAEKIIENWLYWIAIDAVACLLYINKGLNLTAILFFLYIILAVAGFQKWQKILKDENNKESKSNA